MKRTLTILAVALLAACGGGDDEVADPTSTTQRETTAFEPRLIWHVAAGEDDGGVIPWDDSRNSPCSAWEDWSSPDDALAFMTEDAEIVLRDEAGTIIGKRTLGTGMTQNYTGAPENTFDCVWFPKFSVPVEVKFMQLEVAGEVIATVADREAVAADWRPDVAVEPPR